MKKAQVLGTIVHAANLLAEVGLVEVYGAQARRARDAETAGVLRRLKAREATHACEARARVDAPEALRAAAEAGARLGGRAIGAASGALGDRIAIALDVGLEALHGIGHAAGVALAGGDRPVLARVADEARAGRRELLGRLFARA